MFLRVFCVLLAGAIAFLGYEVFRAYGAMSALGDVPAGYSSGPADADLEVVEFLSYGCEWCRSIHPVITEAVERDGRVRYIPRPIPTQDEAAVRAALAVYMAGRQGAFMPMHNAMMENYPITDDETLAAISAGINVDMERLVADLKSEDIEENFVSNAKLFRTIGGTATPTFIIGRKIFFMPDNGMPTVEDFLAMFNEARELP